MQSSYIEGFPPQRSADELWYLIISFHPFCWDSTRSTSIIDIENFHAATFLLSKFLSLNIFWVLATISSSTFSAEKKILICIYWIIFNTPKKDTRNQKRELACATVGWFKDKAGLLHGAHPVIFFHFLCDDKTGPSASTPQLTNISVELAGRRSWKCLAVLVTLCVVRMCLDLLSMTQWDYVYGP